MAPLAFSRFMLAVIPPRHRQAGSGMFHSHQSWKAVEIGMPGMNWYDTFLNYCAAMCSYVQLFCFSKDVGIAGEESKFMDASPVTPKTRVLKVPR